MSNLIIWCTKCGKEVHFDRKQDFMEAFDDKEHRGWYYCKDCHTSSIWDEEDDDYDNPFGWEGEDDEEDY